MAERGQVEPAHANSPGTVARLAVVRRGPDLRGYLVALGGVMMLANIYLVFWGAPTDSYGGEVQRVIYFHVPLALISFLAFFLVFVASIAYLVRRTVAWDRLAQASAEVGVVFVTLALITGVIWAKPAWNTWWTWDPRLTTTLILWLIYVSYLMVRAYASNPAQGARYSAVVGIVGFVDVPIVYYSVIWWRSIHENPVVGPLAQRDALEGSMAAVLLFSFITFLILFVYLVAQRKALREAEDQLGGIKSAMRRRAGSAL